MGCDGIRIVQDEYRAKIRVEGGTPQWPQEVRACFRSERSLLVAPFAPVDRLLIVDVVVDIEAPRILSCRQNTQIRLKIVGIPGERGIGYLGYQGRR